MSSIITYQQCSSVTPEEARNVRTRVWRYVFDCHAKKKGDPDTPLMTQKTVLRMTLVPSQSNKQGPPVPPIDEPEKWKRLLNLLFWLEWDEEYRWLKHVEAAICTEEGKQPNWEEGRGES